VPNPLTLFPAANGYRRRLFEGRAVSVYYDHHPRTEWSEHAREEDQLSAILDGAVGILKWKPPDGDWQELKIKGPTAWLIPAGTPHALVCQDQTEMVTLFMNTSFAAEVAIREKVDVTVETLAYLIGRDALIGQLAKAFRRLCRGQSDPNGLYVESIGTVFGTHLLRGLVGDDTPSSHRIGLPTESLQRVTRFIEEHIGDHLDLELLGRVAGFSPSHFSRLFRASVGLTPHLYVMRRRVAKAEQLLQQSDKKEIEIAFLCGFSDETLMARWFRRVLACRPSEVRTQRLR
jgi:AraC family transcriptional regulator